MHHEESDMRDKVIVIRIPALPKKSWRVAVVVALLVAGAAAYAFAPISLTDPVAGTPVSASMFKANNQAIRDKVDELQAAIQKPIYLNTATGKTYSLQATFCGQTTSTTGAVVDGVLKGIPATKSLCEKVCGTASAHMCTTIEVQRFIATGGSFPATMGWYSAGQWTYDSVHVINDCVSWTDGTTAEGGPVSYMTDPAHDELCNASHPIYCCD
jgi:hypothetical protein